jgi:hypothetical protein
MEPIALMERGSRTDLTRRALIAAGVRASVLLTTPGLLFAQSAARVDPQPYFASVARVLAALRRLGEPVAEADVARLTTLARVGDIASVEEAEKILSTYVLLRVAIGDEQIGHTEPGAAPKELVEQGWRSFLVRVANPFGRRISLGLVSDAGFPEGVLRHRPKQDLAKFPSNSVEVLKEFFGYPSDYAKRWLGVQFYTGNDMEESLSGLGVEYRLLQLFSRDRGSKVAYLMLAPGDAAMFAWAAAVHTGFWSTFNCVPSADVFFDILDSDGEGCTASLTVKDDAGRLYPAPAQRIAPDFDFQPQVYRSSGESIRLPAGRYEISSWRGPEYIRRTQAVTLTSIDAKPRVEIKLQRWINAAALGWYPGDPHVHAAGCAHYMVPTEGVGPETMIRHVRGEALTVGDILTWAPGYYQQKKFFSGHVYQPHNVLEEPSYQKANHTTLRPVASEHDQESLIRYDLEVSGFPSSPCGHLVLLRLRDQNYPKANRIEEWPSWTLPILRWARAQGAACGYGHCGAGMAVDSQELVNYEIPRFDSVGANEYIVAVTHNLVDFIAAAELSPVMELNCWYHTLNCGFRAVMVGESDFPCILDERIGTGRTYVGLVTPPVGDVGYSAWVQGIQRGRLYFGDGRSHFIDFRINNQPLGAAELRLREPTTLTVTARIAARLEEVAPSLDDLPPWHLEHARMPGSRNVLVEVVQNSKTVVQRSIVADGQLHDLSAVVRVDFSSWFALRILPSGHSAPIYVSVDDRPIRASRRSAQWCLESVEALWGEKSPGIRAGELKAARAAYDYAQLVYGKLAAESDRD